GTCFAAPCHYEDQLLHLREHLRCHAHGGHAIRSVHRDREAPLCAREVLGGEERRRVTVGTEPEETETDADPGLEQYAERALVVRGRCLEGQLGTYPQQRLGREHE